MDALATLEQKDIRTSLFTILFILLLVGIGSLNIWVLLGFRKIKFTKESQQSGSHSVVEGLLWTLSILPLLLAVAVTGILIFASKSSKYKFPLIGIVVSLLVYASMQFTISYFWKNLIVADVHDPEYIRISNVILIAGYAILPIMLIFGGLWWIIEEKYINVKIRRAMRKLQEQKEVTKKVSGEAQKQQQKEKKLRVEVEQLMKKKSSQDDEDNENAIEMVDIKPNFG